MRFDNPDVQALYEDINWLADEDGYTLNPDEEQLNDLLTGIAENEKRYGYRLCPCRITAGALSDDMDIICPCDYRDPDLAEFGCCLCTLYVNDDWISGRKSHDPIPERRPAEYYMSGYRMRDDELIKGEEKMISVWRCKVCGYLCAREEPPGVCPICRAKKERFEKFEM